MFCEIAGQGHPRQNIRKATHYLRHQCTRCSYFAVFEMCDACADVFKSYLKNDFNETWCPKCQVSVAAVKVWTVYESVAQ